MDIEEKKYFIIQNLKSDIIYTLNSHFKNEPLVNSTNKLYADTYLLLLKEIQILYKDSKKLSMPTCEHIFKCGSRKGSRCTTSVKIPGNFCYKHKVKTIPDQEIEELPLESKSVAQERSDSAKHRAEGDSAKAQERSDSAKAQERSDSAKAQERSDKKEIICSIRKNNFNNFVFKNTGLIFKNQKEKFIVAKEGLKGEWLPLSENDIEICKENHLRYKIIDFTKTSTASNAEIVKSLFKLPFENNKEEEKN
jgi:hypothetical protein